MKKKMSTSKSESPNSKKTVELIAKTKSAPSEPTTGRPSASYMLIEITAHYGKKVRCIVKSTTVFNLTRMKELLVDYDHRRDLSVAEWRNIQKDLSGETENELILVDSLGYNGLSYLSSRGKIYGVSNPYLFLNPEVSIQIPVEEISGSFDEWKKNVAPLASHSSRMMLALLSSFAALTLHFSKTGAGGLQMHGTSTDGKTTCLGFAASVCSNEKSVKTWNSTLTAIEEIARGYNDSLLIFDELKLLHPDPEQAARMARNVVYMLAEGSGKNRSISYQPKVNHFRTCILSAGEQSLHDHAKCGGEERMEGEQVRVIDVPSDVGNGMGIFESIPNYCNGPNEFANYIRDMCAKYHGSAKPEYINKLVYRENKSNGYVQGCLEKYTKIFIRKCKVDVNDALALRVANRFAFIHAVGCIAIELYVLPFTNSEIGKAILSCYRDSVAYKPVSLKQRTTQALETLRRAFKSEELLDLRQDKRNLTESDVLKARGFRLSIKGVKVWAIRNTCFKEFLQTRDDQKAIKEYLKKGNILAEEGGRSATRSIRIPGMSKRIRCLCIIENVFCE